MKTFLSIVFCSLTFPIFAQIDEGPGGSGGSGGSSTCDLCWTSDVDDYCSYPSHANSGFCGANPTKLYPTYARCLADDDSANISVSLDDYPEHNSCEELIGHPIRPYEEGFATGFAFYRNNSGECVVAGFGIEIEVSLVECPIGVPAE